MRPRSLAVAVGFALSAPLFPSTVFAAPSPSPAPEPATLDAVIVVATRNEGAMADAPATVDVVERATIERTQAQDLRELFRYEPRCRSSAATAGSDWAMCASAASAVTACSCRSTG